MPRDRKPNVDITNRPSDRNSHTAKEWSDHIQLREDEDTRRDIRHARTVLSKLTVRSFAETFCCDEQDRDVREYILNQLDPDGLIGDIEVDDRALRKLADRVGGDRTAKVVANSRLREIDGEERPTRKSVERRPPAQDRSKADQQAELLRALLKTMDPEVVKKALTG